MGTKRTVSPLALALAAPALFALAAAPAAAQERADLATAALAATPTTRSPIPLTGGVEDPTDADLGGRVALATLGSAMGLAVGYGAAENLCGSDWVCVLFAGVGAAAVASTAGSVLGTHTAGWMTREGTNTGAAWAGAGLGMLAGTLVGAGLGSTTRNDAVTVLGYVITQGALTAMASRQ